MKDAPGCMLSHVPTLEQVSVAAADKTVPYNVTVMVNASTKLIDADLDALFRLKQQEVNVEADPCWGEGFSLDTFLDGLEFLGDPEPDLQPIEVKKRGTALIRTPWTPWVS